MLRKNHKTEEGIQIGAAPTPFVVRHCGCTWPVYVMQEIPTAYDVPPSVEYTTAAFFL